MMSGSAGTFTSTVLEGPTLLRSMVRGCGETRKTDATQAGSSRQCWVSGRVELLLASAFVSSSLQEYPVPQLVAGRGSHSARRGLSKLQAKPQCGLSLHPHPVFAVVVGLGPSRDLVLGHVRAML
jgi:hypothetical protein